MQEALPRKALTPQYQPQWLKSKATYIRPSHCQHKVHRHSLLSCYSVSFYKAFSYSDLGIEDVVAGTTLVTTLKGAVFSFTQVSKREFGSIWARSIRLTKLRFISLAPFLRKDIFVFIFENVVSDQL